MENTNPPFLDKLAEPIKLPSVAKNLQGLLATFANDDLDFRQVTEVIKQYPEITARLIFLANSPWSAPINPISSIENACARLGISLVKSLSIAIFSSSSFDTRKCPNFSIQYFWTTAMLVSEGARLLVRKMSKGMDLEQTVQTAGVLHNIGLLWLADNYAKETSKALMMVTEHSTLSTHEALLECTGTSYCEVGAWIGKLWNMPDILVSAIEHHHQFDYRDESWETVQLVAMAASMVSAVQNQCNELPDRLALNTLGLDLTHQNSVFQQLINNFDKTQELAKTMFEMA